MCDLTSVQVTDGECDLVQVEFGVLWRAGEGSVGCDDDSLLKVRNSKQLNWFKNFKLFKDDLNKFVYIYNTAPQEITPS